MVALARTDEDAGLIHHATAIAKLGAANEIRFVHVTAGSGSPVAAPSHDQVLSELKNAVQRHSVGMPSTVQFAYDVLSGPLTDQLLAQAAEKHIDLLLLGHRVQPPGRKPLARRLAMKAPCSVWMVPQNSKHALRRILVPIDFSEPAADSLRVATSLAAMSAGAECLALHVYFNEAVITYEEFGAVLRGQEEQAYRQFIAPINLQGVKVTPLFEEGANVANAIVRTIERHNVDLIVMATRGRSRSSSILLGSVAEETILESPVPILIVKHFGARLGVLQALLDRRFRHQGNLRTD
jgi:nucleotide-binding universal stress UspA family protein